MKVPIISFIKIIDLNFKKMYALEYFILENISSLIIFHSKNTNFIIAVLYVILIHLQLDTFDTLGIGPKI